MSEVRTRIAPSPTGMLHLGTARTTEEAVPVMLQSMRWLELDYDEGAVR